MNLTARIKGIKHKPNYVLNVNINIPIRPSHLQSDRPVSGQFTFSPSQLKKKLKLQIPSARTTYECQSRKLSYLGQTQNTISHRNNRKRTVKSAFPVEQLSNFVQTSKKGKSQIRSETVSPNRKKVERGPLKIVGSQKNIKNTQIIDRLIDQSQDNIVGYTSQSSQIAKVVNAQIKTNQMITDETVKKDLFKKINFKSDSPLLEQKNLISQIRQFQKSAQFKKQHMNYMYLKEKVLVLASVKKIQRAWRNYKTKKLIKSYSNNISLKFTGKLKNQLMSNQETDQVKILTVRSCGYNDRNNQFKRQGKKNLSQLMLVNQSQNEQIKIEKSFQASYVQKLRQNNESKNSQKRGTKKSSKSAVVKFQMQEIQRWDELIKHIRQGKKIDDVLERSFRRKKQLQKQLSNNLKLLGLQDNESIDSCSSNQFQHMQVDSNKYVCIKNQIKGIISDSIKQGTQQVSVSSQNSYYQKLSVKQSPRALKREKILYIDQNSNATVEQDDQEGATTQRRRKKLQYFQNELRKIDNQYSQSSNLSQSCHSELQAQSSPQQVIIPTSKFSRQAEIQQNIKLKKKLEAINKIQLFSELDNGPESQNIKQLAQINPILEKAFNKKTKQQNNTLKPNIQHRKEQQLLEYEDIEVKQFFPISINKKVSNFGNSEEGIDIINDGRLDTFRNRNEKQKQTLEYQDIDNLRLIQIKKKKYSSKEKQSLLQKIQQELLYDVLLQFSQKDKFISKMETLHISNSKKQREAEDNKPEGICTNLESIKDYLQNFVAFAFQQQSIKLVQGFNNPKGPSAISLLRYLSKNQVRQETNFVVPVLPIDLFNLHWAYASQQIYFDVKFQNDPIKQNERVKSLKSITKTYFRAIFDGFNQCLAPFRVYGQIGKPFPWDPNIKKRSSLLSLQQIKPLIRLGYRKLSQMAIIYCGLLFEDKKHSMSLKMIQDIQRERLDTLVELELRDDEHNWEELRIEQAEVVWRIGQLVWEQLLLQVCWEVGVLSLMK